MRVAAAVWSGLALLVLVAGGLFVYRSTAPNGDVVPEGESVLQEEADDTAGTGQFLQLEPDTSPPLLEEADDGEAAESPDTAVSVDEDPTGERTVVSMTDTGFIPAQVTIAAGTAITFVNDGQALHWPASAVHPTHEVLSSFDSRRGIPTGDAYSYTFTETGSWDFHDHLNPQFTGTVTVE